MGGGFVEVIATSGDPHLGGDDFDAVIVDWIVEQVPLLCCPFVTSVTTLTSYVIYPTN